MIEEGAKPVKNGAVLILSVISTITDVGTYSQFSSFLSFFFFSPSTHSLIKLESSSKESVGKTVLSS